MSEAQQLIGSQAATFSVGQGIDFVSRSFHFALRANFVLRQKGKPNVLYYISVRSLNHQSFSSIIEALINCFSHGYVLMSLDVGVVVHPYRPTVCPSNRRIVFTPACLSAVSSR